VKGYNLCLIKAYFDKGLSLMNYPTKALMVIGIGIAIKEFPTKYLILASILYGFLCFMIGFVWYKSGLIMAEAEVGNQYNLFQKEMRKKIN